MNTPISEEIFQLFALFIPRLLLPFEQVKVKSENPTKELKLDLDEILVLMNIKHFGKPFIGSAYHNQPTVLRADIRKVLVGTKGSPGPRRGRRLYTAITPLLEKGLILETSLSKHERQELFGASNGSLKVLILRVEGSEVLDKLYYDLSRILYNGPSLTIEAETLIQFLNLSKKVAAATVNSLKSQLKLASFTEPSEG